MRQEQVLVLEPSADQSLHVEESLCWVDSGLILGGLADQSLILSEGDVGGSDSIALARTCKNLDKMPSPLRSWEPLTTS